MNTNIEQWKSGCNPFTGRNILLWGPTWVKLMENNDWFEFVDSSVTEITSHNKNLFHPHYIEHLK